MLSNRELCKLLKVDNAGKMSASELYSFMAESLIACSPAMSDILSELETAGRSVRCRDHWETLEQIFGLEDACAVARVETGSSEGVWLDVWLEIPRNQSEPAKIPMFVFKHLDTAPEVYCKLGALGGLLTHLLELFIWVNKYT